MAKNLNINIKLEVHAKEDVSLDEIVSTAIGLKNLLEGSNERGYTKVIEVAVTDMNTGELLLKGVE